MEKERGMREDNERKKKERGVKEEIIGNAKRTKFSITN